jgi:uncharacterized membrane protein
MARPPKYRKRVGGPKVNWRRLGKSGETKRCETALFLRMTSDLRRLFFEDDERDSFRAMDFDDVARENLPDPIRSTISAIGRIHAEHNDRASAPHRWARGITLALGNPLAVGVVTVAVVGWVLLNVTAEMWGGWSFDPAPFQWLELLVSIGALLVVLVVLATQQRDDELQQLNQRLILQLAILAEQKAAKTIQLLEELRRDHPAIPERKDEEANLMARPTDPEAVLKAIKSDRSENLPPAS